MRSKMEDSFRRLCVAWCILFLAWLIIFALHTAPLWRAY